MTMAYLSPEFAFTLDYSNSMMRSKGPELTRLRNLFGRFLHRFSGPKCGFNLGYQSADEVADGREPERKPATAFSREGRRGALGNRTEQDVRRLDASDHWVGDNLDDHHIYIVQPPG